MTKRKRTLRERAQDFGEEIYRDKDHPLRFERKNCPGCIADIWLAGYRAGRRSRK